jgi:16S rRNA (adenine1518-N6/adenine1519-N6)-dimethyltransferase
MSLRREARDALAAAGLRPRKRWGQHFLCDARVIARIVAAARLDAHTVVLEIGPGLGALTDALAAASQALYVVEIDPVLAERLVERQQVSHVHVLTGDVLELPIAEMVPSGAVVVANLPYNISTAVLMRLCELRAHFPRAVLMLQREVAERLVAPAGGKQRGVLGVMVQTYAEVRTVLRVPKGAFLPPPAVESAVVEVVWQSAPRVPVADPALYRRVVRGAFNQRRKMLRNALGALAEELGLAPAQLDAAMRRAGIDPTLRAERLELADFARLAGALGAAAA